MKIAYISASTIPSYTANSIHVMKMCQAMIQQGHAPTLYAKGLTEYHRKKTHDLKEQYGVSENFKISLIKTSKYLRGYDYLVSSLRMARNDSAELIYTRNVKVAALGSQIGLKTIYEMHDFPRSFMNRTMLGFFLRGRGRMSLVVISDALRNCLIRDNPALRENGSITVAPDGVDLERFHNLPSEVDARRNLNLHERFTVGYAGHLYKGRGIELIFELATVLPQARFLILGGRPETLVTFRRKAMEKKLANINFRGFVPNAALPEYLAACEVLLMPYQKKVEVSSGGDTVEFMSPMKMFEYMAAERLIISSDLPVLREVLNDKNALLCEPDNINQWKKAILTAMNDNGLRLEYARRARTDVEQYTWRKRVQKCLQSV